MATVNSLLPAEPLKRPATSEGGFIFDPAIGDSFAVDATALVVRRYRVTLD